MPTTGEPATSRGTVTPQATHSWTPPASPATYSSGVLPPSHGAVSDAARPAGYVGGGGLAANSAPGESGRGPATGAGRRGETATQETRQRD